MAIDAKDQQNGNRAAATRLRWTYMRARTTVLHQIALVLASVSWLAQTAGKRRPVPSTIPTLKDIVLLATGPQHTTVRPRGYGRRSPLSSPNTSGPRTKHHIHFPKPFDPLTLGLALDICQC